MNHANIPNDVLKMMIINLGTQGKTLPDVAAGWSEKDVVEAINTNTDVNFDLLGRSAGISLTTFAPYYDHLLLIELNYDIRSLLVAELDTFGVIEKGTELAHNQEGIFLNDHLMSTAVYRTFDSDNERGYFFAAVTGLYFDKEKKPHELYFYCAKPIEPDSELDDMLFNAVDMQSPSVAHGPFLALFSCVPNNYRL